MIAITLIAVIVVTIKVVLLYQEVDNIYLNFVTNLVNTIGPLG